MRFLLTSAGIKNTSIHNALVGFHRLDRLAGVSAKELLALHGVGPKAIGVLRAALAECGLAFAGEGRDGR